MCIPEVVHAARKVLLLYTSALCLDHFDPTAYIERFALDTVSHIPPPFAV